jgi:hypothetical protein
MGAVVSPHSVAQAGTIVPLHGVRYRREQIKAQPRTKSQPRKGTRLKIRLPFHAYRLDAARFQVPLGLARLFDVGVSMTKKGQAMPPSKMPRKSHDAEALARRRRIGQFFVYNDDVQPGRELRALSFEL